MPSPCGMYAECRNIGGTPSCSCLPRYIGSPPTCRPECRVNSDCPMNLACMNEKCRDPCQGSCSITSLCTVYNHVPVCTCPEQYTGDPFSNCYPASRPSKKFKKSWKCLRDQESYIYSFHSWTNYRWSLCIITLWSKRAMQRWCLYMFGRISGWSLCRLSTRVCIEHRLSPKSSLCEKQVYQSLFWYLWSKCRMFGI